MEMFCLGNVMGVGTEHVHKRYTQTLRRVWRTTELIQEPLNHGKCEAVKPFQVLIFT